MGPPTGDNARPLPQIDRVRCLGCDVVYVKPAAGGTVSTNPGCPECGYVGWVLERSPVKRDRAQRRSVAGRLRRRTG
jgi:hypothetical protein